MANLKEVTLSEMRLDSQYLEEAISALLHTILFVRAPSVVKAQNQRCKQLEPLIFAKCGPADLDMTIGATVEMLKKSLFASAPVVLSECEYTAFSATASAAERYLKGEVLLSFFDKREVKEWGGLVSRTENVCFERWRIPVLLTDKRAFSSSGSSSGYVGNKRASAGAGSGLTAAFAAERQQQQQQQQQRQQQLLLNRRHSTGNQADFTFQQEIWEQQQQQQLLQQQQEVVSQRNHSTTFEASSTDSLQQRGGEQRLLAHKSAYEQVSQRMMTILEAVNAASDHVPLSMYDYEIQVLEPAIGEQRERRNFTITTAADVYSNTAATAGVAAVFAPSNS